MDQYLSISCAISDGDLPIHIYWTFNHQAITLAHDVSISKIGKRNNLLSIENVNGRHAGNYTCHAENNAGSTTYTAELKVIGTSLVWIRCLQIVGFWFLDLVS